MSIEEDLRKQLNDAIRARDLRTANVIRMVHAKLTERTMAKDFKGAVDDALYVDVILTYRKSLHKARAEFLAAGAKGSEHAADLQWEIEYLERFLPQKLSPDELRAAVRAAIAAVGAKDSKQAGRVVGEVMKQHKGRVDAGDAKKVVEEELVRGT